MLILSILLGWLGVDRFYAGQLGLGILKMLTAGGCGIWWLADIIAIARVPEAQRRQAAYLARLSTYNGLLSLSPTQFELLVRDLLRFWGYPYVQHTGGGGDLSADLVCRDSAGALTVVQCKRYGPGNLVGSPELQKFIGMIYVHHRAQQGIFVTTSDFTQPARALAKEHQIRLIDGNGFVGYIQQWRSAVQPPASAALPISQSEPRPSGVKVMPASIRPQLPASERYDWSTVLTLSLILGWAGVDRFYTGQGWLGILKLFTVGGLGIWWLIDITLIAMGDYKDGQGRLLVRKQ